MIFFFPDTAREQVASKGRATGKVVLGFSRRPGLGTFFTCFTSTKVQILQSDWQGRARLFAQAWMIRYVFYLLAFTCFTRTKVRILQSNRHSRSGLLALQYLYFCTSKATSTKVQILQSNKHSRSGLFSRRVGLEWQVRSLLALLVQKYKYCRATGEVVLGFSLCSICTFVLVKLLVQKYKYCRATVVLGFSRKDGLGRLFTCFTRTKVQILTQKAQDGSSGAAAAARVRLERQNLYFCTSFFFCRSEA